MSPIRHKKRDLRRSTDLSTADVELIFELTALFKEALRNGESTPQLRGKALAMIFEKPSLRTRVTFELAMVQLGGHAIYLAESEIGIGKRESVGDIGRNLERWFDLGLARTFKQSTVEQLADHCRIPFINGLSDEEHPCQALTDFFTLTEKWDALKGKQLTYIGDGNNICHSLMGIGSRLGVKIVVASPKGYEPNAELVKSLAGDFAASGGGFEFFHDPAEAVKRADAVYTDVWASMGQESEAEERRKHFEGYQVNAELLAKAPAGALVMHDLPAHRGEEITDEALDGPTSVAFDQAENRLHTQKGILAFLDRVSS